MFKYTVKAYKTNTLEESEELLVKTRDRFEAIDVNRSNKDKHVTTFTEVEILKDTNLKHLDGENDIQNTLLWGTTWNVGK